MSTSTSMEILAQKYIPYAEMLAKIGNNAVFIVDKDEHYYFISDKFKLFGYDDIDVLIVVEPSLNWHSGQTRIHIYKEVV